MEKYFRRFQIMKPKMILTDLDHTLLHSDGSISEYTKQILKKCQSRGILIVLPPGIG